MHSDVASRNTPSREDPNSRPILRESDAIWLRRGQRIGEMLLTNRVYAACGWATGLGLVGGSLVLLALLGSPEAG